MTDLRGVNIPYPHLVDVASYAYGGSIAAHFIARHQATPEQTLHWNALAVQHAEAIADGRANELLASLYLNLGEAYLAVGNPVEAASAATLAYASLAHLSRNGYQGFVARGIERQARLTNAVIAEGDI